MTSVEPAEIIKILEIPDWGSATAIKTAEAEFLYDFIRSKNLSDTLETGLAFAKSASHIMAATGRPHIAIDPYQLNYENLGLKNIERLGMKDQLDFRPDFSHNVLPALLKEGRTFDFIFIDGDHKFDGILLDFYYADLLLRQGGYVLMHDTWMRSTRLVERFIKRNRNNFSHIPVSRRNLTLFRKEGEDSRDGMFFREFYTRKSVVLHALIIWMTSGKDNISKRMMRRLKEIVRGPDS